MKIPRRGVGRDHQFKSWATHHYDRTKFPQDNASMVEESNEKPALIEDNEKSDKVVEVTDEVRSGLQERLKFFFSNANIRQDNFMRQFLLRDEGVPVEALMRFNTINKHTKDAQVLIKVARELEDLLVVSKDSKSILRKTRFTQDNMRDHVPLSLYVSNVPVVNEKKHDVTTEEFKKLFEDQEGLVLVKLSFKNIYPGDGLKRPKVKPIKRVAHSSALVEFDTVEHLEAAAVKFLTVKDGQNVEPTVKLELKGQALKVETLTEHEKNSEAEKETKKRNAENEDNKTTEEEEVEFTIDWKPKCVIALSGLAETCDREAITEAVSKALDISMDAVKEKKVYIDFSRGQTDGAIRFDEPSDDVAAVAAKISTGETLVAGAKVKEATVLEGDAEKEYWDKYIEFKKNYLKQRSQRTNKRRKRR